MCVLHSLPQSHLPGSSYPLTALAFGSVHLEQFVNIFPVVRQSRHLVLSAELALGFQPVVEEVRACLDDFESLERDVVVALGLVVGVDGLEGACRGCRRKPRCRQVPC